MTTTPTTPPATHSPLPWRSAYLGHPEIKDAEGRCIASVEPLGDDGSPTFPQTEANADFIVTACNAHAANEARIAKLEEALNELLRRQRGESHPAWQQARSALASVGETP